MRIVRNATANFSEQIHEIFIEEDKQEINDYLFYLMGTDFFPFETPQSMWVLMCDGKEAFLLCQNHSITSYCSCGRLNKDGEVTLQAVYFQNWEARAEYLFKEFGGVGIKMYFSGWWTEYQSYHISKQVEEQWAEKWGVSLENNDTAVKSNVHEAYEFLKLLMKWPRIFVGCHRLDLAQVYFDGWREHQKCMWDISYDMECWLFRTEGVSFTGSILAWSLFYSYFGAEDMGVNKFGEFLANTKPTSYTVLHKPASITSQIRLAEYCEYDMDKEGITEEQVMTQVLRLVRRLLPELTNHIKIYVNKRSFYCQVRIFFYQGGEWVDGIGVCTGEADMMQLINLHAYLHKVIDWHKNQIVVISSEGELPQWEIKPYEAPHHPYVLNQVPEELLMFRQFEQWYREQTW